MRILITGASGFVGGTFLQRFSQRPGLELLGVARRPMPLAKYLQRDLSQPFDLPFKPDVVIHAAALASPWGTRAQYERQNVEATRHVIDFCRRAGLPRLLHISTSAVFYDESHQYNLKEMSPIGPGFVNLYAETKAASERLVAQYEGEHAVLRPRAVFGPGDTVLFPRVIEAARKGALPLFTGQDRPVMGDLIYIDTLCDYLLRAAQAPQLAPSYNLTNAQPVDLQALLHRVLDELGLPKPRRQVKVGTALRAATVMEGVWRLLHLRGEPPATRFGVGVFAYSKTFDPALTLADLGAPSVSLDEGVQRFIQWQRAQWTG